MAIPTSQVVVDPCQASPTPGTVCRGGVIFLGTLSPGATSGSGTDRYMTTPGGCSDIPAGSVSGGSGANSYANADFTPASCSGSDSLTKNWNNGGSNHYDIPGLTNYTSAYGSGHGATNKDAQYGNANTTTISAITSNAQGGYHAAARYCDKLNYGGYTDWYLPNRYELNLMFTNKASIPGVSTAIYWSSTEDSNYYAWMQQFSDGFQDSEDKSSAYRVRCIRKF